MNAKKIVISIFVVLFVLFGAVSALAYDNSASVNIKCYAGSYAETYAKNNNIEAEIIPDSEAYIGVLTLESFDYNNNGTIVAYKGSSEKIAIPTEINGVKITTVAKDAFKNSNVKSIYIPNELKKFEAKELEGVTLYMYESSSLYKAFKDDKKVKFKLEVLPDSYHVNFITTDIPFSYNNISDKSVDLVGYTGSETTVLIPEAIEGKVVTAISFDALEQGIETIIIPKSVTNINGKLHSNRYDLNFALGLIIAFVGAAIATIFVLTIKAETKEKAFLSIPQFRAAYVVSILSLILAGLYIFVPTIPDYIIYAVAIIVYGIATIYVVKAKVAVEVVEGIDEKIKVQTFFIKSLTVDAEHVVITAKTPELKTLAKKVYEAVRYSDPMSNVALVETEDKIQNNFYNFENAVEAGDFELASSNADELLSLIDIRNKKCKLLK